MRKRTTKKTTEWTNETIATLRQASQQGRLTMGLDLGDHRSHYCILNQDGDVLIRSQVATQPTEIDRTFRALPPMRVAMEVGTHSPWVSRRVQQAGHEVVVANAREVAWITQSLDKVDPVDGEKLARLARVDTRLLSPIRHRSEAAQRDRMVLQAREGLVAARTKLINMVRGLVKPLGERVRKCTAEGFGTAVADQLSAETAAALRPVLESIDHLNEQIAQYDAQLAAMEQRYPEVELLQAVHGVGTVVSLSYVLTIEDPGKFAKSREVGPYLGLTPGRRESGEQSPELGISKEGDHTLRKLLVQSTHCLLRKKAPDSDLRRWGWKQLGLSEGGPQGPKGQRPGKNRKKRVIVALARRLAVLLHHLWANGEVYDPLYGAKQEARAKAPAQAKVA